jgi:hypothetical protein
MDRPTAEDMARDLVADMARLARLNREMPEWVGGTMRECGKAILCMDALPAAIRRALAAEHILRKVADAWAGDGDIYGAAKEAAAYFEGQG